MMAVRFHIDPRDVPADAAARRMGLTEADFRCRLPELEARGFPKAILPPACSISTQSMNGGAAVTPSSSWWQPRALATLAPW